MIVDGVDLILHTHTSGLTSTDTFSNRTERQIKLCLCACFLKTAEVESSPNWAVTSVSVRLI